jgi:hypothetical protein
LAICHDVVATIGLQTWREDIELPDGSRSAVVAGVGDAGL